MVAIMKPCIILSVAWFTCLGQVLGSHDNRCHHKRFLRCATAISHLQVPMIESKSPEDFSDPQSAVKKFCRKAQRSLSCVYNRLPDCEGHVKTDGVEDRAGMLSYVCGEGRKDLIAGSSCWLNNNVASRIRHCKAKHDIDNIATRVHDGNITDTYAYCGSLDNFVWACMGDWTIKRCPYNLSAFIIRALNPERLSAQLKC
ncbi:uncharacterized protein [Haliotis cracherodii]|uniref:uncharacterized protein n=1 Tax=Haliotis cracherodii TaxID=6455 RepID=UPI0039E9A903